MAALATAHPAAASTIEIEFTGRVLGPPLGFSIADPLLSAAIQAGDPVVGRFSYDPSIRVPAIAPIGSYEYRDPRFVFDLQLGDAFVGTDRANPRLLIQILDDWTQPFNAGPIDRFGVISNNLATVTPFGSPPSAIGPAQIDMFLPDWTTTAFTSGELPFEPIDATLFSEPNAAVWGLDSAFGRGQFTTQIGSASPIFVNFSVETWAIVPEPGTAHAVGAGLLVLAACSRRRGSRRRRPREC